jgi:hypothetical protein
MTALDAKELQLAHNFGLSDISFGFTGLKDMRE